jgi:hypothetical protein
MIGMFFSPAAIVVICVGYGAGIWFTVSAIRRRVLFANARNWLSTRGRIIESTLYPTRFPKVTHFQVRYEFSVGERIEGSTPRVAGAWFLNDQQQAAFVSRYSPGQAVQIYYDPSDPTRNCLDRTDASGIRALWFLATPGALLASLIVWGCLLAE